MKSIKSYLLKYWYRYAIVLLAVICQVACNMIYPQLSKHIVNDVLIDGKTKLLIPLVLGILACGAGKALFGYIKEYTSDITGIIIGTQMREELYTHVQQLSMDYFARTNTGTLLSRIKDDVDHIWFVMGFLGAMACEIILHIILSLYFMIKISPLLTIIPAIIILASGAFAIILERKLDKIYGQISEENAVLTSIAEENLTGVRTVKAFAREKYEIRKFIEHNHKYYELNMKETAMISNYDPVFTFIGAILPVSCAVLGGIEVINGKMDLGSLVAYIEYASNSTWPMGLLGWITNDFSSAIASRKKIVKIFEETASVRESDNPITPDKVLGHVEFDHVDFSIDDKKILSDISFDIPAGHTLGIMGATGSGKSTIVNLIERFYDVTAGSIMIDGHDIRDLSFEGLRSHISVVTQDVFLFSDTISENIRMGERTPLTEKQIYQASELAQVNSFVDKMDEKYETIIGERGVGLSGGQKQRISMARAFAKNSSILVLDDSTSALDMETERDIQHALNEMTDCTKIIIGHRISAVRHADEIIYLRDGAVAERGTHEELLKQQGLYFDTFQAQYAGGDNSWQ